MLNPLQAASSFACDGCGHHASFHTLKNAEEESENFAVEKTNSASARAAATSARKRTAAVQGANTRGAITNGIGKRGMSVLDSSDDDITTLNGEVVQVVKRSKK